MLLAKVISSLSLSLLKSSEVARLILAWLFLSAVYETLEMPLVF